MLNKALQFLATCLCFTAIYSATWTTNEPWLAPATYVDDGRPLLEFTCAAYLLSEEQLLFGFQQAKSSIAGVIQIKKYYSGYIKTNLYWPIDQSTNGMELFCVKKNESFIREGKIKWNTYTESTTIPIAFQRDNVPVKRTEEPQVWPATFIEDGKPYIEFTCCGRISQWQLISWFQVKEQNVERIATSLYDGAFKKYRKVKLVKTLETSDKGSEIYCATEEVLEGGNFEKKGESKRILLTFDRRIDTLKTPYVAVQPDTDTVVFEEHEELEFVCGGGARVDGRGYTWHMEGSKLHSYAPPGQSFDTSTNLTRLYLRMEVFYHGSQLYCAHDFAIKPSYLYGEVVAMSYRELARSRQITLLHRKQENPGSTKITPWWSNWSKTEPWVTPIAHVADGKPFVEFTCHSYLRALEYLSWFNGTEQDQLTYIRQLKYYNGYRTLYLLLPADQKSDGIKIFCGRQHSLHKSKHTVDKSEMITIDFKRNDLPLETSLNPQVTPEKFVDDGSPYIEFTCWAYLRKWDMLTWFQIKDSNLTERLAMTQQEANYGYVKVELLKGLRSSDKDTKIYCAKENVVMTKIETDVKSESITITFNRLIEPMDTPHVTVEPRTDVVLFDDNAVLEFVCGGSEPVDGRGLTWYSEGPYLRQVLPVVQRFNKRTNQNRMSLRMEGPYHGSRLYCAQDFTLKTSPVFGELITTSYGELARSRMITLLNRNQDNPGDKPMLSPKQFVDESKSFIEFTCYAFLKEGETLSWYQSKESRRSKDTLLRTIQLQHPKYKGGQWMEFTLNKTLEQSDKGSDIYCAKQSLRADGSFSDEVESQRLQLTFSKDIPSPDLPFVIIEPHTNVIYFDVNTTLRFVCSGSIPLDGRTYTWLRIDPDSKLQLQTVPENQKYDASTNLNVLHLSLKETYHQSQLYCAQGFLSYIRHTDDSLQSKIYGEMAKSDMITLILPEKAKPLIIPENVDDKNKSFIQFTCRAFLQTGELLSWYQSKGSPQPETILLQMIQHQDPEFKPGQWIELSLKKNIEQSDKDSEIYCAKQSVLPDGSFSDGLESLRVPLTYSRDIPPLELPHINIEPSTNVHYAAGTTLRFTCSGSYPVDDRTYTWFRIDSDSNRIVPEGQKYDASSNQNVLELSLSETYNRNQLYCAQGFLSYIRHADGTLRTKFYGELSKSEAITLILHVKGDKPEITPETFEDKGDPFVQFTCHAFLERGQLLSWYQSQGSDKSKDKLLRTTQLQDPRTEKGQLVTLILKKTLEPADKDSEIYCVKQSVLPDGSSSGALESQRVPLTFKRDFPLLELPFVIIEPHTNVIYFDINATLHFTCSGSTPVDGRTYTWLRMDSDLKLTVLENQKYDASTNLNVLNLSLSENYHQSQLYCAQGFLSYIQQTDGSLQSKIYGELAKSDMITLILPEKARPQITPENFVDKKKSFIQFTCRAFLQTGELLSWYQSKGSPQPETILLQMIQLQDPEFKHGQWIELSLKKTIEQSDKDSEIYCAKQSVLPDGSFSDGLESQRVPLTYSRDIPPLELTHINIEPSTNVHYAAGTTLRFTCSGSYPVDDRTYTWFRIDSDSNRIVPEGQKYDASSNQNVLELSLSETYNRNQLYCAQGFLSYIRHADGTLRTKFYGELSKSEAITLVLHVKGDKPEITPETFEDKGDPFVQFTCHAFLERGQLLSWYQSQGSDKSKDKLLRTTQLQDPRTEKGQLVTLILKKTLEPADKDSEIYCVKQSVLPDGSSSGALESQRVPLTFKRDFPLLELPFVIIEPHTNVMYFDINATLHFTCSGSTPVDGRTYTWLRMDSDSKLTVPENQKYDASTNLNVLNLSFSENYHQSQLYCAQGFLSYIQQTDGSLQSKIYGELAKSDMITLILPEKARPQITPENFVDKKKSFIQFTCRAFLQTGELLSWYQSKGSPQPETILLQMIQLQDPEFKHGQWIELSLKKTIEQSDKDSEIYCAKQSVLPDGSFSDGLESQRVPLTYSRDIPPLELTHINIEPSTNVHYAAGTTLRFTCSGSYPVDDRTYTWFRIDSDSNRIVPEGQKYDASSNQNVLELSLSETYNRNQLYCAQGFLSYIRHADGTLRTKFYGELSKSEAITLVLHVKGDKPEITPETFEDKGDPFVQFTCHAFLERGQLLSWYQSQGSDKSKDKLLRTTQLQDPRTEKGQLVTLILKKTLEPADKDSEIYCVKQSVLPDGSSSGALESQRVPLTFKRDFPLLELPFVIIEPHTNVMYFDINATLHFTCSGSTPVDGRTYTWLRMDSDSKLTVPENQKYDASTNLNVLNLSFSENYHQSQLYCAQGFLSYIQQTDGSLQSKIYGELAKSDMITLILPEKARPQITPENFVDKKKSFIQFTCRAFLQTGELLSWYQSKGSPQPETILLRMIQLYDPEFEHGQWMELSLKKTLEQSDKDSEIFCSKQNVLPNGSFSDGLESQRVPLTFSRDLPPLELPHINIEPNTNVHYVAGTTMNFTCSGSHLVDDSSYTWFRIDSDSSHSVPEGQKYDASTHQNILELSLIEHHNRNQLYCAQGFLSYIRHSNGSLDTKFYGELSKSDAITLVLHVKGGKPVITPEDFVDKGDLFIQFTCHAILETGQLLSWYQSKEADRSKDILLNMSQLQDHGTEKGQLVTLILKKTLEPSDKYSKIYCVKQNVLPDGSSSDALESERVQLTFKRDIPVLELPYIITEPNTNVIYFNIKDKLRFTCSGSIPVDGRTYTWLRIDSDSKLTVPDTQKYDVSTNLNVLHLPLNETYHQSQLYCAQGFLSYIRYTDGSLQSKIYGELSKSKLITLILPEKAKPQVTPENFEDENKSFIQFTCRAFLQTGELLSWYQLKGSPRPETILLQIIQPQDPEFEHGQWIELALKKTLEQSDKDSKIYCVKQSMLPDGSFSDGLESRRVPLTFSRVIPPLELSHINIEPSTNVHYVADTTMRFTCSGSHPVDDRTYTWFWMDSELTRIVPESQKYDASTHTNVLELSLSETYNRNQLYCAQGFLSYIRHADGSLRTNFYGELSKSDAITLILLEKDGKPQVSPQQLTDELKSSIKFNCYAYLRVGELLSWYQSKGKDRSEDTLLRMIQLQDHVTEEGRWMELTLNKTLERSDNGSEIYCARQSVLPGGSFSDGLESQRVPLTIHRDIPDPELPYVTIEPTSSVHFEVDRQPVHAAFLRFTCSGSSPVDGRTYTWFRIDPNSNVIVPEDQKYDASTNMNVLYLSPSKTYHQSQLYCAQGFLSVIRHADGSPSYKFYGELAKSSMVTLIVEENAEQPMMPAPTCPVAVEPLVTVLSFTLPLALAALAAVLVARATAAPPECPRPPYPPAPPTINAA